MSTVMKWHWGRPRVVNSSTSQDPVQKIMETDYLPLGVMYQLELELACFGRGDIGITQPRL
jgi:hypothetical protein